MFVSAVVAVAIILARASAKRIKVPWYRTGAVLGFVSVASLVIGIRLGLIQLIAVACLFCALISVIWFGSWESGERELSRVTELADPLQLCRDDVAAFVAMERIQTEFLSSRQLARFNQRRVLCYIALGDCGVAQNLLEQGDFEPAFGHFALSVIANGKGDYELAKQELSKGLATASNKSDPFVLLQLEHNRAIERIDDGQFQAANDELEKVRAKVKREGVHDTGFLNLLYGNLVLNKTRLGAPDGGAADGWSLIDEYAKTLDLASGADRGALFNMKLMFLRQLRAGRDEKAALFANVVDETLDDKSLSEGQRAVAMASLGRIAWADGLNPARVLEYFGECDLSFKGLQPQDRVFVFKNLSIMLNALMTNDPHKANIAHVVASYIENGMEHDLDEWESKLPAEAIKQRANILGERAALCQQKGENHDQVLSYLKEAIDLLEQGLQVMDALEFRWELAKCLLPFNPDEARKLLFELEKRLGSLGAQPSLGYPYYELFLCYALLGMRRECRTAFAKATSAKTVMDHYTPIVRRDVVAANFCARFYLLTEALESPERLMPYLHAEDGKNWLERYPDNIDTLSLVVLSGRFLGYAGPIPVERRMTDIGEGRAFVTYWIVISELGLVFDPGIKKTGGVRGAVFLHDDHPVVSNDSNFETLMQHRGFEVLPLQFKPCDESDLSAADRTAVGDILEALDIVCKREHPSSSELLACYRDGCEDVPIEG